MRSRGQVLGCALLLVAASGCLGARSIERNYYMLEGPAEATPASGSTALPGRVYVRDLEIERIYDKFKLVLRKSPYVLQYSGSYSWAVRPNRMISDIVAEQLVERRIFSGVSRELAEGRPDYTMTGRLRAIEVLTEESPWRARISLDLSLVRFDDGAVLWHHAFDESRRLPPGDFDAVPEAISAALHVSLRRAWADLVDQASDIRSRPLASPDR